MKNTRGRAGLLYTSREATGTSQQFPNATADDSSLEFDKFNRNRREGLVLKTIWENDVTLPTIECTPARFGYFLTKLRSQETLRPSLTRFSIQA